MDRLFRIARNPDPDSTLPVVLPEPAIDGTWAHGELFLDGPEGGPTTVRVFTDIED